MDYYLRTSTGEKGPFSFSQLRSMWAAGNITRLDEYREEGLVNWRPLAQISRELDQLPSAPPLLPSGVASAPSHQDVQSAIRASTQKQIEFDAKKKSGALAAVANFFIPGAGYMYCDRVGFGIFVLIFTMFIYLMTLGYAAFLITPILVIDGFLAAGRYNEALAKKMRD